MKRRLLTIGAIAISSFASAQLDIISQTGSLFVNGSPSAGPTNWGDSVRLAAGGGNSSSSSATFGHIPGDPNSFTFSRSALKFEAIGDTGADYMLPSDDQGNMSVASEGDRAIFGSWGTSRYPQSHQFSAQVNEGGSGDLAEIDIDAVEAPNAVFNSLTGPYLITMLDGQAYDLDSRVGFVKINKFSTPSIVLNYTLPSMTFGRNNVQWSDGSEDASMHRDAVATGTWTLFEGMNGGPTYIFGSAFESTQEFAPGESASTKVLAAASGNYTLDLNGVNFGTYNIKNWAINWHTAGYNDDLGNLSLGGIQVEQLGGELTIVPEPSSLLLFGGLAGLALLRRKK